MTLLSSVVRDLRSLDTVATARPHRSHRHPAFSETSVARTVAPHAVHTSPAVISSIAFTLRTVLTARHAGIRTDVEPAAPRCPRTAPRGASGDD